LEVRSSSAGLLAALQRLAHQPSALATQAEREVSRRLGGSCSMPLAAHAVWQDGQMTLNAALGHATEPQQPLVKVALRAPVADADAALALGRQAAEALLAQGGQAYLPCGA
jgi:hydroxymethylbilane synthase